MKRNEQEMDLDKFLESLMKPEYVPTFPFSLHYSEGCKYFHMRLYQKAMERLDKALQDEPSNVKALLTRAKVHIYLCQYEQAKEDAIEALKVWPGYSLAFDLKGRSEYLMGDFEGAYLTYLAGRKVRPDIEILRLGQQLCEESMKNSMRKSTGMKINKDDVHLMTKAKKIDEIRFAHSGSKRVPTYERFTKDKKMLKELLLDENVKQVHVLCKESLDYIHHTERFWAMQKPLHGRKKLPTFGKRGIKKGTILQLMTTMKNRCQEYLLKGYVDLCIADGEKLVRLMESRPGIPTEKSIKLKAETYHMLGKAYETKQYVTFSFEYYKKELEIAQKSEFIHPQIRAFHHLGMYYLKKKDYQNACSCFLGVAEALKPESLKKYLEERDQSLLENEEKDKDLADIKAAATWARDFRRNLTKLMPSSAANDLLLEKIQEDIGLMHLGEIVTGNDSESDKSENYLTANEGDDSTMSVFSDESQEQREFKES